MTFNMLLSFTCKVQDQPKKEKHVGKRNKDIFRESHKICVLTLLRSGHRYVLVLTVCLWGRFSHCCGECLRTMKYFNVFITFVMIMMVQVNFSNVRGDMYLYSSSHISPTPCKIGDDLEVILK